MQHKPGNPHNPYAAAATTYATHAQAHTPDQRELEARVLLKSAQKLQDLRDHWESMTAESLDEVLRYNRQIWLMFVDTAVEDENPDRPIELRNNIANLGVFIFKRTLEILSDPRKEKLSILIDINREIAAGLLSGAKKSLPSSESAPPAEASAQAQPTKGSGSSSLA